jgi:hypothetical protein
MNETYPFDVGGTASTCERFWRPQEIQEEVHQGVPPGVVVVKEELPYTDQLEHSDEHARMLRFTQEKVAEQSEDWVRSKELHKNVTGAIDWIQGRSVDSIIAKREKAIQRIERRAKKLVKRGDVERWLSQADTHAAVVSKEVNGPLMVELCKTTGLDSECVEAFRKGAPILRGIPAAKSAVPHDYPLADDADELAAQCYERNQELLGSLRADAHEDFLMAQTVADAGLGRMTEVVPVSQLDLRRVLLSRRFSREQGMKTNGQLKLRAVDDMTGSGVNGCAQPEGKTQTDAIDTLVRCAVLLKVATDREIGFWKADIDAAYRRVPIQECDKWASWIAFVHKGEPVAAGHHSLMFGSLGSVHGWDKIGDTICHIARRSLHLAVGRYVDDFFAAEVAGTEQHAMECFTRLVRALLGPTAIKAEKVESGLELNVLGLHVSYDKQGMNVRVTDKKASEWSATIRTALKEEKLSPGTASKLAGRLSFAAQHTFKRAGRAALRALFRQQYDPMMGSKLSNELRLSLQWWLHALEHLQTQTVPWEPAVLEATLFTDARSTPPRVAAVLVVDGVYHYTDWAPDAAMMATFAERKDNQIMGLELLGIAVGICSFEELIRGRSLRVYCDNVGGERALASGAATSVDHNRLVHAVWMRALQLGLSLWSYRVPTKDNIADLPSREEYELLRQVSKD